MPFTVGWDQDIESTVLIEFEGLCTFDEFHAAVAEAHSLIRGVGHTVDVIAWHRGMFPPGNLLFHITAVMKDQPPNTGLVVIIAPTLSTYLMKLVAVIEKLFPTKSKTRIVGTIEQARVLLTVGAPDAQVA